MVERSDKMWSTGEGNGKPLQYSCLENTMNSMKRQKDRTLKDEVPRLAGARYATWDQWRNNSRMKRQSQSKNNTQLWMWLVMEVKSREQYCIGTWNVRSMNQAGKLEVIRQETASMNVDMLGISELKWTGMGEFNSDDHYIYYCGRNELAIMVNKRVWNAVLGCNLKNDRMISVCFRGKSFNSMVIQV